MKVVKDKKILNKMKKEGFIIEPKYDFFPRVDSGKKGCDALGFTYRDKKYRFKYFDGNFYPLLIEV